MKEFSVELGKIAARSVVSVAATMLAFYACVGIADAVSGDKKEKAEPDKKKAS